MHRWEGKDVCRQYVINKKDISKNKIFFANEEKRREKTDIDRSQNFYENA